MRVHVPVHLSADRQLVQPVAVQATDLFLHILQLANILWQVLLLAEVSGCQGGGLNLVDDTLYVSPASRDCLAEDA